MRLTSTCYTCHRPKNDLRAINCEACTNREREAQQYHAEQHPNATEAEILYAGRQALQQEAHHAHRNFVDPRTFSASRGMIPTPPQTNRGSAQ